MSQREGGEKGRSAETCKNGRATNVVRGRDSGRQEGACGELPEPDESSGILREQLCPGNALRSGSFCGGLNGTGNVDKDTELGCVNKYIRPQLGDITVSWRGFYRFGTFKQLLSLRTIYHIYSYLH